MWIQVRTMDGKVAHTVNSLSRLTKVENLRRRIQEVFHVEPGLQRLFYRGKQMEDGHTLFDYDVRLNDTIQLLVRQSPMLSPGGGGSSGDSSNSGGGGGGCCCPRKRSRRPDRSEEKAEREREERRVRQEERRAEMKSRHDEIRRKYGLFKEDNPYARFENN